MGNYYINKERIVLVEVVPLKICLTDEDFKNIMAKIKVTPEEANAWM
jgi:hypothetical protein